jgi:hypothetical protein
MNDEYNSDKKQELQRTRAGLTQAARSAAGIILRRRRAAFDPQSAGYSLPFRLFMRPPVSRA